MSRITIKKPEILYGKAKIMKKVFALAIIFSVFISCVTTFAAGKQSASAYIDQDGNEVCVTVDLSDGWSVDFARDAVYLYDGQSEEAVAVGLTLDEEVYNGQITVGKDQKDYTTQDGIVAFTHTEGSRDYYFAVGEKAYFMITVSKDFDGDAVMARFTVEASGDQSE